MHCILCRSDHSLEDFYRENKKVYYRCEVCQLVFLDPRFRLPPELEKAQYDLHENSVHNPGYVRFLEKLVFPLVQQISIGGVGLDFGCGPGPTLSVLMKQRGFEVELYDPIYFPAIQVLSRKYDFVTCTEVVEHLFDPHCVWQILEKLLKPGGILGVMTQEVAASREFDLWYYRRDPTHVCFYSRDTFRWISSWLGLQLLETQEPGVFLLAKS